MPLSAVQFFSEGIWYFQDRPKAFNLILKLKENTRVENLESVGFLTNRVKNEKTKHYTLTTSKAHRNYPK